MKFQLFAIALASACLAGVSPAAHAAILFDFGTTPGLVTGADALISPGHATGAVPNTETVWNLVTTADLSTVVNGNGTTATGVTLNLGVEGTVGSNIIDFTNNSINSSSLTGGAATTLGSIYGTASSNPAGKEGIFRNGASEGQNAAIGLRIDGLDAGLYSLFYVGRNTNSATIRAQNLYTLVGTTAGILDFSTLTPLLLTNALLSGNNTFVPGVNYLTTTATIGAGQSLYVIAEGTPTTEQRGFFNSLEIAAIPEPSSMILVLAASTGLLWWRRR